MLYASQTSLVPVYVLQMKGELGLSGRGPNQELWVSEYLPPFTALALGSEK